MAEKGFIGFAGVAVKVADDEVKKSKRGLGDGDGRKSDDKRVNDSNSSSPRLASPQPRLPRRTSTSSSSALAQV